MYSQLIDLLLDDRPILILASAPIPVVLAFIYLSQQATLLHARLYFQACTVLSRIYSAYAYNPHTPIPHAESHFQYK